MAVDVGTMIADMAKEGIAMHQYEHNGDVFAFNDDLSAIFIRVANEAHKAGYWPSDIARAMATSAGRYGAYASETEPRCPELSFDHNTLCQYAVTSYFDLLPHEAEQTPPES